MLQFTDRGIYCPDGDFYIDAWKPVNRNIVTHAHSDHARPGHRFYLAHHHSEQIMQLRLGKSISLQTTSYGRSININGVQVSLHPAGHIPGSAQIRITRKAGEVWVVSGDYKTEDDGLCTPFEPLPCDTFISECTFGMPVYHWKPQQEVVEEILKWWQQNQGEGKVSFLFAYALGKAQRLINALYPYSQQIFVHGAVYNCNEALIKDRVEVPEVSRAEPGKDKNQYKGSLIIAPPSAMNSTWMRKFGESGTAIASGWMSLRGARRRRAADRGFVISDHADWKGLQEAIHATGASQVVTTHGYTAVFTRWLNEQGIYSREIQTSFEGEDGW
ncbi:MAG: ligase-associated DNA damage response exonuclease [Cyclobacteriaceae bacterium]|nr:ligase-associated DNA damage response exonuclease [Cyclobacteriaceae bacterium]